MGRTYRPVTRNENGELRFVNLKFDDCWDVNAWGRDFYGLLFQELGLPVHDLNYRIAQATRNMLSEALAKSWSEEELKNEVAALELAVIKHWEHMPPGLPHTFEGEELEQCRQFTTAPRAQTRPRLIWALKVANERMGDEQITEASYILNGGTEESFYNGWADELFRYWDYLFAPVEVEIAASDYAEEYAAPVVPCDQCEGGDDNCPKCKGTYRHTGWGIAPPNVPVEEES